MRNLPNTEVTSVVAIAADEKVKERLFRKVLYHSYSSMSSTIGKEVAAKVHVKTAFLTGNINKNV